MNNKGYTMEEKKLAVINLVTDFPFEYRVAEIERWSGLSTYSLRALHRLLNLEIMTGRTGGKAFINLKRVNVPFKDYLVYGKLTRENSRNRIDVGLSLYH